MSTIPVRYLLLVSMALTGCNAAGVQPETTAPETTPPSQQQAAPAPAASETSTDELLSSRITSIQEYLLQLKRQNGELQQQNQALQLQLQAVKDLLNQLTRQADAEPVARDDTSPEQLQGLMDQLGDMVANMDSQAQGSYRMSSAYTAQGQWIVIRYDQVSGDAWLADRGQWQPLQELEPLPVGDYEISLLRADQDKKGYVAIRLDRLSGATWWLNQDNWQAYAE